MYEQYTDKQIVEMLVPKLNKAVPGGYWNEAIKRPELNRKFIKAVVTIYRSAYIRGQLGRSFIIGEKKVKEPVNTFKVGDKVKFLGISIEDVEALNNRRFYPPVNTVGKVVELGSDYCFVQWPKGTTADNGVWACRNSYLEKITEHWVPATKDNVEVGSKVRYLNAEKHEQNPEFYPVQGTVGEVISVSDSGACLVQWHGYITSWFASWSDFEVLLCE